MSLFDTDKEDKIDGAFSILELRVTRYGNTSPLRIEGRSAFPEMTFQDAPELMMCLIFSLEGVKETSDESTKLFERLSKEAARFYLSGEAHVVGFPSGTHLKDKIKFLAEKMHEKIGPEEPDPNVKDEGVDVVAWKPFDDYRSNQIFLLLQCGAGKHYKRKTRIPVRMWCEYLKWAAEPVLGIMIPQIIPDNEWTRISRNFNLIFDRIRIHKAVYGQVLRDTTLRDEIKAWCTKRLNKI